MDPIGEGDEAGGEEGDVEAELSAVFIEGGFVFTEEVDEHGGDTGFGELAGDEAVARTVAATATAMSENHETVCRIGEEDVGGQGNVLNVDQDAQMLSFTKSALLHAHGVAIASPKRGNWRAGQAAMRPATYPESWKRHAQKEAADPRGGKEAAALGEVLKKAGIRLNGEAVWDLQVRDERFYRRLFIGGTLGLGEAYMEGWWEAESLDEFICRVRRARLEESFRGWAWLRLAVVSHLRNLQNPEGAKRVAVEHYDIGNELFEAMLDSQRQYSCGYWPGAQNLEQAQERKLDLIARKLRLRPGMRVLELGGGFGGFARFAAEEYGCEVVSYNISRQQVEYAREWCRGLRVRFEQRDYREARKEPELFDRVVSVGMCEHIGPKNLRIYLETAERRMKPEGLFLLHTIGANESVTHADPWIDRYIFRNGVVPSIAQLGRAMEGLWVMEDWHNFGPDYDRTLMAWWENFEQAWPRLRARYGERFYRMWKYYLLGSAGSFRARTLQLWQVVLSRGDIGGYEPAR